MITDALNQLSSAQTVTGSSPVLSTNTIDQLVPRDLGEGQGVSVMFQVGTAFAGLTALEMQAITADDAALSSNVKVIGSTGAIPVASLAAGARFIARVNPTNNKGQRYVGARYVPTGTGSAGTLSAVICDIQSADAKQVASGFTVS